MRDALERLVWRVKSLALRCLVRSSDDARRALELSVDVLSGESLSRVERFAHYGFTSRPRPGAEAVVLCLGGNRDHPVVIAEEDRTQRPVGTLAEGEVLVYAAGGARVHLKADGSVVVTAPAGAVVDGDLEVTGDVTAGGDVSDALGKLSGLRAHYNVHVHTDPQGGSTGPPLPTDP